MSRRTACPDIRRGPRGKPSRKPARQAIRPHHLGVLEGCGGVPVNLTGTPPHLCSTPLLPLHTPAIQAARRPRAPTVPTSTGTATRGRTARHPRPCRMAPSLPSASSNNSRTHDQRWMALSRAHRVFGAAEAEPFGISSDALRQRAATGGLQRVGRGWYAPADRPLTWTHRVEWATRTTGGVASHRAAAVLWKLEGFRASKPEVLVPFERRVRPTGVKVHRTRRWSPAGHSERNGIAVVGPAVLIGQLASYLPRGAASCVHRSTDPREAPHRWRHLLDFMWRPRSARPAGPLWARSWGSLWRTSGCR
jgi:hypothetical protein